MISVYKYYCNVGYSTKFYDFLTPQAYFDSLDQVAQEINENPFGRLLDVGCGSGLLINFLKKSFFQKGKYIGGDRLVSGLKELKVKSKSLGFEKHFQVMAFDLTDGIPITSGTINNVVAHFSIYTLENYESRQNAYREIYRILKPQGNFLVTNPSKEYNAKKIIKESLKSSKTKVGVLSLMLRRFILYPLTLVLGLNYIEKQLKSGVWHASSLEEFCLELESIGFEIKKKNTVYGGGAYLLVCIKN